MKLRFLSLFMLALSISSQGQNYWQQQLAYTIEVRLDDKEHFIHGFETLVYTNNAPEELKEIYMHLWPNAYKNNNTPLAQQFLTNRETKMYFAKDEKLGYIDSLNFVINGNTANWSYYNGNEEIAVLKLDEPLKPGKSIKITTPFRVKIPDSFSRLGHLGESYQLTQWYPKPAVYDKNGWHPMPYLNQGEFYSDYGSFDVSITLPKNYVVAATGALQTQSEIEFINAIAEKTANTEKFTESNDFPESDKETKTIQYKLNNIHDFAWFADKRFVVRKSKVTLPNSGRNVDTYVYFRPSQAQWWKDAVTYVDSSVYYYSLWVGDYPYDMCTALDGALSAGGGMEYPTITIINETKDAKMLDEVIAHEVGHNWFYGILGSNERDHAWMDEGINSYYEARYMKARYPKKETDNETSLSTNGKGISLNVSQDLIMNSGIGLQSNRGKNQALDLTSAYFSSINYGILVYKKTAMSLDYLAQFMGQEKFDKTMQRYYEQWQFKHPYPEDLKQVFNSETGKDYSWFFNDLFESSQPLDYKMSGIKKTGNNAYQLSIVNKSVAKAPLELTGLNKNNEIVYTKLIDGFEGKKTVDIATSDKVQRFEINHKTPILDPFLSNNTIYTQKLFKKVEPIKLNLGISIPSANKTNINLLPAIGYNVYDGFMLGMAVYNSIIDLKNTEYFIAPMYGFESKKLTGVAMINQYFYPKEQNGSFLKIGVSGKKFSSFQSNFTDRDSVSYNSILGYIRVVPAIEYVFKRNNEKPYIQQRIALRSVMRWLDGNHFSDSGTYLGIEQKMSTIQQFTYTRKNVSVLNPWSIEADMQQGKKENAGIFVRASLEAKFRVNYNAKNKFFEARAFAGGFLYRDFSNLRTSDADLRLFNYSGQDDYLYDGMYIGRNESTGFWSRQVMIRDGGMKLSIPQLGSSSQPGRNNQWLLATNLSSTLPSKIPFRVFVDAGIFPDTNSQLTYVGGLSLPLINDQVQVFFPLIMSDNLKLDVNGNQSKWAQRISFTLNIHNLNIYKILREIDI